MAKLLKNVRKVLDHYNVGYEYTLQNGLAQVEFFHDGKWNDIRETDRANDMLRTNIYGVTNEHEMIVATYLRDNLKKKVTV